MSDGEVLVIVEVQEVLDPQAFQQYREQVRSQFAGLGGVLAGRVDTAYEGDDPVEPVLLQRWPNEAAFRAWQASDDYKPLKALRQKGARIRLLIVPLVA